MAPKAKAKPQTTEEAVEPQEDVQEQPKVVLPYSVAELAAAGRELIAKHTVEGVEELIAKHKAFTDAVSMGAEHDPADLRWVLDRLKILRSQQD